MSKEKVKLPPAKAAPTAKAAPKADKLAVVKEAKEPAKKYGVADLAEAMGIEPASVRVQLRKSEIEKSGKSYGWDTKDELKSVISQLRPKAKAGEADETEE